VGAERGRKIASKVGTAVNKVKSVFGVVVHTLSHKEISRVALECLHWWVGRLWY
jgi:hypothetical protein